MPSVICPIHCFQTVPWNFSYPCKLVSMVLNSMGWGCWVFSMVWDAPLSPLSHPVLVAVPIIHFDRYLSISLAFLFSFCLSFSFFFPSLHFLLPSFHSFFYPFLYFFISVFLLSFFYFSFLSKQSWINVKHKQEPTRIGTQNQHYKNPILTSDFPNTLMGLRNFIPWVPRVNL